MSGTIIYYTDNKIDPVIANAVQRQLLKMKLPIISISLSAISFGKNIVLQLERSIPTMFKQILAGLEEAKTDFVFFCEHDVIYHPSHFSFLPRRDDLYYYNENIYKVEYSSGKALFYYCQQTSGLCADRKLLLNHYQKKVQRVNRDGYDRNIGFEPGTHNRKERIDDFKAKSWMSDFPNLDIRHKNNLTKSRWRKDQFRNQKFTDGWKEVTEIPGWGRVDNENIVSILRGI